VVQVRYAAELMLTIFPKKYKNGTQLHTAKSFAGPGHFVPGRPTWRGEADYILDWLAQLNSSKKSIY